MSFGVGISDIVEALRFVKITYEAWRDAPEKYRAVKQKLRNLRSPLQQLATDFAALQRVKLGRPRISVSDLHGVLSSVEDTLDQLNRIIAKRSDLTFWDRLRLTSHEISDLSAALDRHIQDLTLFCGSLGLQSGRELYKSHQTLHRGQEDLKRGQDELIRLLGNLSPAKLPAATREAVVKSVDELGLSSTFVSEYCDDDGPGMCRAFRRKAIAEGVTGRELELYHSQLHEFPQAVGEERQRGRRRSRSRSRNEPEVGSFEIRRSGSRNGEVLGGEDCRLCLSVPPPRYSSRSISPLKDYREQTSPQRGPRKWPDPELILMSSTRERSVHRRQGRRSYSVETEVRSFFFELSR